MGWQDDPVVTQDLRSVPVPKSGIPDAGPSSALEDVRGVAKAAGTYVKTSALPTIGSLAVPAAATALFPPAAALTPVLRGVGSGLGEVANQLLGITEPSVGQIGLATGLPMAMEMGSNLIRTGVALPKALNTAAPHMASRQLAGYASGVPATQLFEQATKEGVTIPLGRTTDALQTMRNTVKNATPAARKAFEAVLRETGLEDVATTPNGISPDKMQYLMADIGKLQAQAAKEGGLKSGYLSKFFSALSDDLEASGSTLDQARKAFKRETVLSELDDAIKSAFFVKKGQGQQGEFSANKILNMLNKDEEGVGKFFAQSFTPKEQREVKDLLGFLNTLPSLKPGAGINYGSGRAAEGVLKAAGSGGIGGGIGFAMGGPAGAAIGAGVGSMVPEAANFGSLVLQAWRMPGGRQIVKSLLTNSDGAVTPRLLGTLGAFVAGKVAQETKPVEAREPLPPTMVQPMGLER